MAEFKMPSLGADMEKATLVEWRVQPGDAVNRGDIIAEVETDKGNIEVEVFDSGVVSKLLADPGDTLPVGSVMALITPESEEEAKQEPETELVSETASSVSTGSPESKESAAVTSSVEHSHKGNGHHKVTGATSTRRRKRASPLARRLAADLGIDLAEVEGSGPGGAIQKSDIEKAAKSQKSEPQKPEDTVEIPAPAAKPTSPKPAKSKAEKQAGMRRAIAAAMSRSNRDIPHYYLEKQINFQKAQDWLEMENQQRPVTERLLQPVVLVKAVAKALGDVPELNGFWKDDEHQPSEAIHIGFAISLRTGGLMIPAIHDADQKSLTGIMQSMQDLTQRTRAGKLTSSEMMDATITITNLGDRGVDLVHGVIYPPQLALVGFGKVTERPWAEDGMLGVKPVLTVTLAADHRATDGRKGSRFLNKLDSYLQEPQTLGEES